MALDFNGTGDSTKILSVCDVTRVASYVNMRCTFLYSSMQLLLTSQYSMVLNHSLYVESEFSSSTSGRNIQFILKIYSFSGKIFLLIDVSPKDAISFITEKCCMRNSSKWFHAKIAIERNININYDWSLRRLQRKCRFLLRFKCSIFFTSVSHKHKSTLNTWKNNAKSTWNELVVNCICVNYISVLSKIPITILKKQSISPIKLS